MTKTIDTLVADIEELLEKGVSYKDFSEIHYDNVDLCCEQSYENLKKQLVNDDSVDKPTLRMSNLGTPCERKLWYSVNSHEHPDREKLEGFTKLKFMYGDLTESMILLLARMAGHEVICEQAQVEINGIKGHIDCIIDGVLIDVKSASTPSFKKFKEGKLATDDPFGYIPQLQSYLHALQDHPLLDVKDRAGFLVFDKVHGTIHLDMHEKAEWSEDIPMAVEKKKEMLNQSSPPPRDFNSQPEGASGNMSLPLYCQYCDFKRVCYPELRTFLYKGRNGYYPKHLTKVVKEPKVEEVLYGKREIPI